MANVTANVSQISVNVTATPSIVNVSTDGNIISSLNISTTNVAVSSTELSVNVSPLAAIGNSTIRQALSVDDTGGDGSLTYSNVTGIFTYTGPNQDEANARIAAAPTQVRTHLGNTLPITYDSVTGVIGFDANLDDLTLKKYQETVVDNGSASGDITANISLGTVHQYALTGDVTGITLENISEGGSATLFLNQDALGSITIDLTTTPANWTNWNFTNDFTQLSTNANDWSALNVLYDGVDYYATLITETAPLIETSDLANTNVTYNGITVELGATGNIDTFNTDVTVNANLLVDGFANITANANIGGNAHIDGTLKVDEIVSLTGSAFSFDNLDIAGNIASGSNYLKLDDDRVDTNTLTISSIQDVTVGIQSNGGVGAEFRIVSDTDPGLNYREVFKVEQYGDTTITGELTVAGNVEVAGNLNYRNVEDLYVRDQSITLNANATSRATVEIIANRPGTANTILRWNESSDIWEFTNNGSTYYPIPTSTSDLAEGTNLYYTDSRFDSRFGLKTTDNLTEGAGNKYYSSTLFDADFAGKSTDNLAQGSTNLYYSSTLFDADLATKTTDDLTEGSTNLYYTDAYVDTRLLSNQSAQFNSVDIFDLGIKDGPAGSRLYAFGANIASANNMLVFDGTQFKPQQANTSIVAEGSNLYYTDGRFDTRFATKTTDDLTQGSTNLYYANALVADYMQDYVTNNFAVTPTVFDLSNALSNINSITHENGNDITLNSESKLVLTQQMNTSETVTQTGNIKGDGYAVILDSTHAYTSGNISQQGTNNLNAYAVSGSATAGSNVFTITGVTQLKNVYNGTGVIDGTNNDLSLTGDMVADMIFDNWNGVDGSQFPYPPGTRLVSANTSALVFTESAVDNLTFANAEPVAIVHGGYDSTTGQIISFVSQDDAVADGTQVVNIDSAGNFGMFPLSFTGESPIAGETNDSIVIGLPSTPTIPGGTPVAFANVTGTGASNINGQTLYINRDVFGDGFNYTLTTDAIGATAATMTGFGLSAGASGGGDITYSSAQSTSDIAKSRLYVQGAYGFGKNGPTQNDFAYTTGSASDYTIDLSAATTSMRQRTALDVERGVLKAPTGLVIGENTEMSNRGEKDSFNNFGLNMMWDGLTDIGSQYAGTSGVIPQILFKAYTDNTSGTGGGNGRTGPRLLFSSATGNSSDSEFEIYPLENQEIGRTTYWGTTQQVGSSMSTVNPAGFISATAAADWTNNNKLNMSFAANGSGFNNADVFIKYHNGKLVLASADLADAPGIHLAPAETCTGDGSQTYATLGHTWANVNYSDTINKTGSALTITQGNADATSDGDLELVFDRQYIAGTATDTMGTPSNGGFTTFGSSGLTGSMTGNEVSDQIILQFADFSNPGLAVGTEVTFADVEGDGNSNLNGQTFYVGRVLFGAIVTLWTSADGTTTPALGATVGLVDANAYSPSGTGNGTMQWTVTGTSAKQWSISLDQGTDNLKIKSNGTNVMHFTDERVHIDEVFRLHNLTTAEINALPNPESGDTVYNTTLNQICFYNGSAWQKITSATM